MRFLPAMQLMQVRYFLLHALKRKTRFGAVSSPRLVNSAQRPMAKGAAFRNANGQTACRARDKGRVTAGGLRKRRNQLEDEVRISACEFLLLPGSGKNFL